MRLRVIAVFAFCLLPALSFAAPKEKADHSHAISAKLNEQGIAALQAGDLSRAEKLLREAVSLDPYNLTAVFNLSGAYLRNEKSGPTIELLKPYAKDDVKDPGIYVRLGDAYFSNREVEPAREAYEKAYSLEGQYPGLAAKLGTVYSLSKRFEDAERMLLQAAELDPKDGQIAANLSSIFLANDKFDKSISAAKKALSLNPSSEVYITLGTAYEMKKDFKNSLIAFQRAADLGDDRKELQEKIENLKERGSS